MVNFELGKLLILFVINIQSLTFVYCQIGTISLPNF